MYNHKKFGQIISTEKMLRDVDPAATADNIGDFQRIMEKKAPHQTGNQFTTTEDQLSENRTASNDAKIIEKVLNEAESAYVDHRKAETELLVPPIATLVEKARLARLSNDYKTEKDSHWSIEQKNDNKKQQGALPKWPKHPAQNDLSTGKIVLNNDPRRFEGDTPKPLIGHITTAHVNNLASAIKTGQTMDYDTAIVAILKQANDEKRELTDIEQKTIVDLKKARTAAFLK